MQLQEILFSQGFGTRRVCSGLVEHGFVLVGGIKQDNPAIDLVADGLHFTVQGVDWQYQAQAYLMLNKPVGYECSQKPSRYPSVYTMLPAPIRERGGGAQAGVQAVGRLDQDTSGLLLLSDDGKFIHRMSSPKHHVPKVYEIGAKHAVTDAQLEKLLSGVVLDDDPKPVRAAACTRVTDTHISLTLTEGKYHQVKRMLAAVGNRVETLHRSRIGGLQLPADLAPGHWRWLSADDLTRIKS